MPLSFQQISWSTSLLSGLLTYQASHAPVGRCRDQSVQHNNTSGRYSSPSLSLPFYKGDMQQLPGESGFKRLPPDCTQQCLTRSTGPSVSAYPRAPPSQYKGCVPPGMAFCGITLPLHGSPRPLSACASQLCQLNTARACEKKEHHQENVPTRLGYGQAWGCIFLIRD